jgi:CDP-glycerol glycerophosphotransferase (TagB/SpsB family)
VRVLVDSRTPVNYEMVLPVVNAMRGDDRVEFAFTASDAPARIRDIYRAAEPGTRLIGPGRAALTRWNAYLTSDFMWAMLPLGTVRIQMFHGVAGKYGFDSPTESMRDWHRLFFVNQRRLDNFVAAGAIDPGSPAARLIGMPKVDCLVDGSLRREGAAERLGLDPSRPIVLYAPTWSPESSLNQMGIPLIEQLLALPVNLIVKLHDRSRDPRPQYSGGVDWAGRCGAILDGRRARLADGANIAPYLAAADVLVTDHSSAGFEYLLLNRPIVRIHLPDLLTSARVHPDYARLLAECAENVDTPEQTIAAVDRALVDGSTLSATRQRIAADLFYKPGTATARCAAALYEVLELTPPASIAARLRETESCLQSA